MMARWIAFTLVALLGLVPAVPGAAAEDGPACGALPAPNGSTVTVATVAELQEAVDALTSGTTILIEDGTYDLTNTLNIRGVTDVAIRSASGNRDAVELRGRGMANAAYGNVPHAIAVYDAQRVTIADLTLRDAYFHLIQIHGEEDADEVVMRNLHLVDAGEQFVKGSTAGHPGPYADDGVLECSLIEYTSEARSWYTNGIDVLAGAGWTVRDNTFRNIRAPEGQLAGPAVLFWRNSLDTVVERNLFLECDRAIALGLSSPDGNSRDGETTYDHQGGVVRNNMIHRTGDGDIGISVNHARDVSVTHNTVIQNGTFPWGTIEYRFSSTDVTIEHNLTDGPMWQRDGASGSVSGNVTNATGSWFVDEAAGDLHLAAAAVAAIDAAPGSTLGDDHDGHLRPVGTAADVGADEYGSGAGSGGFIDVPATHRFDSEIAWLVERGITLGCTPDGRYYCPTAPVTRAQMASFLDRALVLPAATSDAFGDDDGSTHEAAIDRVAQAGITGGCTADGASFCPDALVTRAQMASFIARALDYLPVTDHGFADVSGTHAATIGALVANGVTNGCDAIGPRYCPGDPVTRGQMAAFLYRALGS